ncbi:MAG: hypothetical protein H0W28_07490 [Pyrinomonadaceae bacterium]|nr:hypothetical protein [Pyrinomonadaceae bacterium]
MVTITNEAIAAGVTAAGKMGFLVTHTVMAPILEAAFKAQFGPDVGMEDESYKLFKIERELAAIGPMVQQIAGWVNTNGPALEQVIADGYHPSKEEPYANY